MVQSLWNNCSVEHYHVKVQQCKVTRKCNGTISQQDKFGELENHGAQYNMLLITLLGQRWSCVSI